MKTPPIIKTLAIIVFTFTTSICICAQETPQLSDAEIANVAVVANQIDIDYAKLAIAKSNDAAVREFANTMINDHQAIIDLAVELVTKLGINPKDNPVSKSLLNQADETTKKLKSINGKAFDQAYINNEVAYHKTVIDALNTILIPQSQNTDLEALLKTAVPILETHYHHAKMAQSKILKK
ncbi:DUF4142 domain-containing protein [Aequorivita xiaoshiensis]|uniref:DUF4142 domain-containing protein n=1 Tax=Aequorivita xiaoshiensis TaxID=2874476 RepID=A0A9X1R1A4_9FLAO|nr:DUF4142 domain-containing protein [Aequorivita xiaoshiensis]MCG2430451.1 DUF4142 domain-containing protein [Aequorivita xiaoshiensis]